jgi:putative tricarboxylic transport membrane protein
MRLAFSLTLMALAASYTWGAFTGLDFLTANGRLGPGFFPRVIGVLLMVTLLYSFVADRRSKLGSDEGTSNLRDLVVFAGLAFLFVGLLDVVGAMVAMIAYMLAALTIFNPRRHLRNVVVSVLLPIAIYLMFDTWLNAGLPRGILPFLG